MEGKLIHRNEKLAMRAWAPGKAPADEEGSSSKKAASAATAKGAAPGKTPPAAAGSAAQGLISHESPSGRFENLINLFAMAAQKRPAFSLDV